MKVGYNYPKFILRLSSRRILLMSKIVDIKACQILDSRGNPTIETTVYCEDQISASFAVPSGASVGKFESLELRDNNPQFFLGRSVNKAVENIEKRIKGYLLGMKISDQEKIDKIMIDLDGTENKSVLGANSILSVSIAVAKAAAKELNLPIYKYVGSLISNREYRYVTPMFNIINGGLHGNHNLSIQEFLLVPKINLDFHKSLQVGTVVYQFLKEFLKKEKMSIAVGDEGGFTTNITKNNEALDLILMIIKNSIYKNNQDIFLGLDLASSTYFKDDKYFFENNSIGLNKEQYNLQLINMVDKYKLISIEDPFAEEDYVSWNKFYQLKADKLIIIGDDLTVTNYQRLKKAISENWCNAIIIKINQVGTLTETLSTVKTAKENNLKIIVSHRSGETNDDFIADLAVGIASDFVKFGAPARGERVAKYNRLLRIYQELGDKITK